MWCATRRSNQSSRLTKPLNSILRSMGKDDAKSICRNSTVCLCVPSPYTFFSLIDLTYRKVLAYPTRNRIGGERAHSRQKRTAKERKGWHFENDDDDDMMMMMNLRLKTSFSNIQHDKIIKSSPSQILVPASLNPSSRDSYLDKDINRLSVLSASVYINIWTHFLLYK